VPQKPAAVAPPEPFGEVDELLFALLAVPSEGGWHAPAAAMSQELFDRLKRWHVPRLARYRRLRTGVAFMPAKISRAGCSR
jgi:hypothetical protein